MMPLQASDVTCAWLETRLPGLMWLANSKTDKNIDTG